MTTSDSGDSNQSGVVAPRVGSGQMPTWQVGELPHPPVFAWRNCFAMLGPGLFMAGAAIGGGEWLTGPVVTARYGGGLLWLATLSILGQVVYNVEVSRYTLYTGEPIFAGKLRTFPSPMFWLVVYLMFDVYMIFPYMAAAAATPLVAMFTGEFPRPDQNEADRLIVRAASIGLFLVSLLPLVIGGKIYNSIKWLMYMKIVLVLIFLLTLAAMFSNINTWKEITSGFLKFGNVPILSVEDVNGNGQLDAGEDFDSDGRLDPIEPVTSFVFDVDGDGEKDATDIDLDGQPDAMVTNEAVSGSPRWPDLDGNGKPDDTLTVISADGGEDDVLFPLDDDGDGRLDAYLDFDRDGSRDGGILDNIFLAIFQGRPFPKIDFSMAAFLCALVAISGNGGLGNSSISNYTREQGWGMGAHVGAIPSIIGGRNIQLSHVGMVFEPTEAALVRWRKWFWHVARDQWLVWMPGCLVGVGLPAMMSLMFLPRGFYLDDAWQTAVITADGVRDSFGAEWGGFFWTLTILCSFLVLATGIAPGVDGLLRRWVDVYWIASRRARNFNPGSIRYVYFAVLIVYAVLGVIFLCFEKPTTLLFIGTLIMNFAFCFTCLHTLVVNTTLLPKSLRPGWFCRVALLITAVFFLTVATIATITSLQAMGWI